MTYVSDSVTEARLSQAQAARFFGVTQPRVSNLMQGGVESLEIDSLVNMLGRHGMRVVVSFEVTRGRLGWVAEQELCSTSSGQPHL
jgi:predicted XRE-type DNA-binding protein